MPKIPFTFAVVSRILILPYTDLRKYQTGNIIFTGRNPESCHTELKDGLLTPQTVTYLFNGSRAPTLPLFPDRTVPSREELEKRLAMLKLYPEDACLRRTETLLQEVLIPDDVRQRFMDTDSMTELLSSMLFYIFSQSKPQKGPVMWRIERLEARIKTAVGEE